GVRFKKGSVQYATLLNWLKDGAPRSPEDPKLESVTVDPPRTVSRVGAKTQLRVTARWTDGRVEDVTQKAVYASADEPVATVSDSGLVTGARWGGTAIQVRFLGTVRAAFFTLPQERKDRKPYPEVPRVNVVDRFVFDNLRKMNVIPSDLASDAQFCRRVYLDTIGLLPTPEELEKFVQDPSAGKRAALIDALLERPEWVDLRTLRLADLLRVNPRKISNDGQFGERCAVLFYEWIRDNVAKNRPYNLFVKDLLSARGSIYFNGPASYWMIERSANDRAETTGQAFLGVRLQCARCHKHPFDRWTTDDYWDFSAFHGKVGVRQVPGGAFGEQEVYYNPGATVVNQSVNGPRKGLPARPTFLGEKPLTDEQQKGDISQMLAEWVVARDNPFFARATMNRLWSFYFKRGLVHPVDDMRETTPESVPGLLDALAKEFVGSNYDIKHMVRLILNSRTYQLSAVPNETNTVDDRFYSHFYPRPMLAQVLLDVVNQATGVSERLTAFPLTRTVELPLPANNYFLNVFGQSHREYLTDLDPKLEPNLVQTLHMMNSGYVNGKIRSGVYTRELARSKMSDEEAIRGAFVRTLCRQPGAEELAAAQKALSAAKNRQEGLEDLLWALISSREFLFVS
ncbi:MAG TPA: DUF1549 domain-containing protein, partial [Armatimonadota bacterium]|nr:DUF1549 domain-containing protein [Armatimonadota bacterium]